MKKKEIKTGTSEMYQATNRWISELKFIADEEHFFEELILDYTLAFLDKEHIVKSKKTLDSLKKNQKRSRKSTLITKIYKNKEDSEFGINLIKKVILNKDMLKEEIGKIASNWDSERIAQIDLILLQMCLTEFLFFDSIPVKVSINEYLELAKE